MGFTISLIAELSGNNSGLIMWDWMRIEKLQTLFTDLHYRNEQN